MQSGGMIGMRGKNIRGGLFRRVEPSLAQMLFGGAEHYDSV
jgi:hypothetical protein